ncbi:MAG TPA: hypothetical protein VGO75_02060, partial [Gemmatimonadaceae bacterium]|nr:hypothetical protein [Gemmatimonadaceae bacterium]
MTVRNYRPAAAVVFAVLASTAALACRESGPKLTVGIPKDNSHFPRGETIHFAADLNSNVDFGVIDQDAWRWASDRDGELAKGPRLDTPNLSVGEHHITASVRHKLGLSEAHVT